MRRFCILVICLLSACSSSNPNEYYKLPPVSANETPAFIKGCAIDSKRYGKSIGSVFIKFIDGKEIEEYDNGGMSSRLGPLLSSAPKGIPYPISPGKHVIIAAIQYRIEAPFEIVLNAQPGERYKFVAIDEGNSIMSFPTWRIWIEDSSGKQVTKEQRFSMGMTINTRKYKW